MLLASHIDFPRYIFTSEGEIISFKKKRALAPYDVRGYPSCKIVHRTLGLRHVYVHTVINEVFHGARPTGYDTRHLNGIRTDSSADNLAWGTRTQNEDDKRRHNRHPVGERHGQHKLTERDVIEIRRLAATKMVRSEIVRHFGICNETYRRIVIRKAWAHI